VINVAIPRHTSLLFSYSGENDRPPNVRLSRSHQALLAARRPRALIPSAVAFRPDAMWGSKLIVALIHRPELRRSRPLGANDS